MGKVLVSEPQPAGACQVHICGPGVLRWEEHCDMGALLGMPVSVSFSVSLMEEIDLWTLKKIRFIS